MLLRTGVSLRSARKKIIIGSDVPLTFGWNPRTIFGMMKGVNSNRNRDVRAQLLQKRKGAHGAEQARPEKAKVSH